MIGESGRAHRQRADWFAMVRSCVAELAPGIFFGVQPRDHAPGAYLGLARPCQTAALCRPAVDKSRRPDPWHDEGLGL